MEVRVLKYFLTVAREENITRASEILHISQPALSRQLMQLEEELGTQLFVRGRHSSTLTEAGMLLRRRAQEIVDLTEKREQEFQNRGDTLSGTVSIGSGETDTMRSKTDTTARGKYDSTEEQDKSIAARIYELAQKYAASMTAITFAWHFKKGIAAPIIGATKAKYLDDAVRAFDVTLTDEDVACLDEAYVPHKIVGAL